MIRLIGRELEGPGYHAIRLAFVGRRTRVPWVDCFRGRNYAIVVDRIERAEYLEIPDTHRPMWARAKMYPPSPEGTLLRRLEDEALAGCEPRRSD